MTLSVHALSTYATVRDELGLTGTQAQTRIERLIEAASAEFESLANRHFENSTAVTELLPGYGDYRLILRRVPVVSITTIKLLNTDGTVADTATSTDFKIEDADAGFISKPGGWYWTARTGNDIQASRLSGTELKMVEVVYNGGYITPNQTGTRNLPYDIEESIIQSVVGLYRAQGRDPTITSETSAAGSSVSYGSSSSDTSGSFLTTAAKACARRYYRGFL